MPPAKRRALQRRQAAHVGDKPRAANERQQALLSAADKVKLLVNVGRITAGPSNACGAASLFASGNMNDSAECSEEGSTTFVEQCVQHEQCEQHASDRQPVVLQLGLCVWCVVAVWLIPDTPTHCTCNCQFAGWRVQGAFASDRRGVQQPGGTQGGHGRCCLCCRPCQRPTCRQQGCRAESQAVADTTTAVPHKQSTVCHPVVQLQWF